MKTTSAELRPTTANEADRTVEVVFSTGSDVVRAAPDVGTFVERLTISQSAIDTSRLIGAPVLDTHRQNSLNDIIGQVLSARVESDQAIALLRIDNEPVFERIKAGAIRAVSAGYEVLEIKESEESGMIVRNATKWRPLEISFVPIGADADAKTRSRKDLDMPDEITPSSPPQATPTQTRAATVTQLRQIANIAALGDDWIDTQAEQGATLELARSAAFEQLEAQQAAPTQTITTRQTPLAQIIHDHDAPEVVLKRMGEALYARSHPEHQISEPAKAYTGFSMIDLARETLQRRGHSHRSMSGHEVITRSLHTTSDFAIILGDTVGRSLRAAYQSAPAGIKDVARQTTAKDFRSKQRIMLGEAPTLEKVAEAGEYTRGSMAEAQETYKLETFGRIIGISRQAIINDDLGAFTDVSRRLGIAASDFEAEQLTKLLESNPTMADGQPVFHESHNNLAAVPAAMNLATIGEARLAMRTQTGLSGQKISVVPSHLLVPPHLETIAQKWLTDITANRPDDVNPFSTLGLVVEPRLTDEGAWYLHSNTTDGIEYAYLEGSPGPQTESRNGFDVDGVEIKIRLDFGAGFIDHRAFYKQPGSTA